MVVKEKLDIDMSKMVEKTFERRKD